MRTFALSILLVAGLAGCLAGDESSSSTTTARPPAQPYTLDCMLPSWSEPCLALASPNDSDSKTEVDVAVNPTDPDNVVVASKDRDRLASNCVWAVPSSTHDGGQTWAATYIGGKVSERAPGDTLYAWECITDPIMVFNKDGDLYYALQTYKYNPAGLPYASDPLLGTSVPPEMGIQVLAVSHDGGATFPELIPLHAGDEFAVFHDYMRMGTNPMTGTVFTIWNQLTALVASTPTLVAYEPGMAAARPPVYFVSPDSPTGLGESGIVGMADGTVVAWLGGFNSPNAAYFATSDDDGLTFGPVAKAFDFTPMAALDNAEYRWGTSVELAVDNSPGLHAGCLYAVWGGQEADTEGPSDIYTRSSCDKGATWSKPVLVNADTVEDGQWMPRVVVDDHGTVHIVYFTRHYDDEHFLVDAEWAYSLDGGATWTTKRLTTISFDANLGIHQNGFPFIGDYIGISTSGDHTWMAFPSTVTGRAEIAVAHVVADPAALHGPAS